MTMFTYRIKELSR